MLALIDRFLDAGAPGSSPGRGLPIGNLTSQHFANLHLSELDHLILERTPASAMVRYMDDTILFADSKQALWSAHEQVERWLSERGLSLKTRQTILAPSYEGLPFLGFRLWPGLVRLDARRRRRFARKVTTAFVALHRAEITEEAFTHTISSLIAFTETAASLGLRRKLFEAIMEEVGQGHHRLEPGQPWRQLGQQRPQRTRSEP